MSNVFKKFHDVIRYYAFLPMKNASYLGYFEIKRMLINFYN